MASLAPLLEELLEKHRAGSRSGSVNTDVPGVHLFWATEMLPRTPLLYSASIVIVGQGFKIGYLGDRKFRYDSETYLVLGVPIPFECETHATPDESLLGISIDIDLTLLHALVARSSGRLHLESGDSASDPHAGVEPAQMNEAMIESTARLLNCLRDPLDSKVLGGAAVNEIVYRVLRGEKGRVLYNLTILPGEGKGGAVVETGRGGCHCSRCHPLACGHFRQWVRAPRYEYANPSGARQVARTGNR